MGVEGAIRDKSKEGAGGREKHKAGEELVSL